MLTLRAPCAVNINELSLDSHEDDEVEAAVHVADRHNTINDVAGQLAARQPLLRAVHTAARSS